MPGGLLFRVIDTKTGEEPNLEEIAFIDIVQMGDSRLYGQPTSKRSGNMNMVIVWWLVVILINDLAVLFVFHLILNGALGAVTKDIVNIETRLSKEEITSELNKLKLYPKAKTMPSKAKNKK